mgnify:CR=1 FL=1
MGSGELIVKDMPSLKSFACTIDYNGKESEGVREIEKQIKDKWKGE